MRLRILHIIVAVMLTTTSLFGQTVNIGDILCTDGSTVSKADFPTSGKTAEGIVFFVDPSGQSGWAVNLEIDTLDTDWVNEVYYYEGYDIPELSNNEYSRQALFDLDGYSNTAIIRITHGADWYPAAWCVDFDNDWYLPAAGQMRWLLAYVNEINESLAVVNGTPFVLPYPDWHWTSTERDGMHSMVVSRLGSVSNYMKWNYYHTYTIGVRSIRDFSCNSTAEHRLGDIVVAPDGQKGVVFYVSPEDNSYWLTALNDLPESYAWGPDEDLPELNNIADTMEEWYGIEGIYCGYDATQAMRNAQGNEPSYAASHVNLEHGWHIPSTGQLSKLYAAMPHIEEQLIANGGALPSGDYYWCSTECSSSEAWTIDFGANVYTEGQISVKEKQTPHKVRPVWSESCGTINLPTIGSITSPDAICADESLTLEIPETQFADTQGWQLSETADFSNPVGYDGGPLGSEYNGWYLRYYVANVHGTVYSNAVRIIIWPTYTSSFQAQACNSYNWNGTTYTESGDYTQELSSLHGCDSIVTLHLTIAETLTHEWSIDVCDHYTWNDITYNEPGDYVQEFESVDGCDSIVTLHLTIVGTLTHEWSIEACDHYTWNDTTYTEPGDYVQELESFEGCDSIVTLHLSFTEAMEIEADTVACGSFLWVGQEYTESGVYDHMFVTQGGCDSLVHLQLTVAPYPESVGAITGPTEVYVGTDLILGQYFYSINPVGFADHYEWELEGADWPMDTTGLNCTLWVTSPGDATLRVKAWNGCGFTERETIIHAGFFDIDEMNFPVALYPNPANDKVFIEAEGIKHITVYNLQGQCIIEKNVTPCNRLSIPLQDLGFGLYLIEIQTDLGIGRVKLNVNKY